jgi:hypothetical protein
MKLREPATSKRLVRAVGEDAISFICGLPGVPVPLETLKTLFQLRRESSPYNFVDWELRNWMDIYCKQPGNLVTLSYQGKEYRLPEVLILDNTSLMYSLSDVRLHLQPSLFQLRPEIRALTEIPFQRLAKVLRYSNEENLRLVRITKKQGKLDLTLQRVLYEDYLRTNLVLDAKIQGMHDSLRQFLHHDRALENLNESPLANNLGINILLLTADGSLIIQQRSKKVALRRGEFCPSGSGTVSLEDVPEDITLDHMHKLREALEEIGIRSSDVGSQSIVLLGITRELIRGGEPEMFLSAVTSLSQEEVRAKQIHARDKWEVKKLAFHSLGRVALGPLGSSYATHEFLRAIDGFLDRFLEHASIPLLTNIALWADYRLKTAGTVQRVGGA